MFQSPPTSHGGLPSQCHGLVHCISQRPQHLRIRLPLLTKKGAEIAPRVDRSVTIPTLQWWDGNMMGI